MDSKFDSRQEIFTRAWNYAKTMPALAQGNLNGDSTNLQICMYRTSEGRKCLMGERIPDADYRPSMERSVVSTLLADPQLAAVLRIDPQDAGFARGLQACHDTAINVLAMMDRLRALARLHNLTVPQ